MIARADLGAALDTLRQYGTQHIELTGRALPPWMQDWAAEQGVAFVDSPDAPLGHVYLRHKQTGEWKTWDLNA